MSQNRAISISTAVALGLFLALLWALSSRSPVVRAQGPDGHSVYYVAPSCTGLPTPCFETVQAAVDAADAPTDVIKVAAGTYTGVNNYEGLAQVVYISKTVTIRGGYTTAFAEPPDPDANLTILDAGRQGRVICITGTISPMLEGLHITGGSATGLGGDPSVGDAGGGVYLHRAMATISHCAVYDNMASAVQDGSGGGLYLSGSPATLNGNAVFSNTAAYGGGLCLAGSAATLSGNTIFSNTAQSGGGLRLWGSAAALSGNTVASNTAQSSGGGLYLFGRVDTTLISNTVSANTASSGGGLYLYYSRARLSGNTISSNTATSIGGGLCLWEGNAPTLSDNIIVSNTAHSGGGLYLWFSAVRLNGNIIVSNTAHGTGYRDGGGGLSLRGSGAVLSGTTVISNTAADYGGGLNLWESTAILSGTTVSANTAIVGGGLFLNESTAKLDDSIVTANAAGSGGGLYLSSSDAMLRENTVSANTAAYDGGGLLLYSCDATLVNNFVTDNISSRGNGSGLYIGESSPQLRHNTIARNHGGGGEGLYVADWGSLRTSHPQLHNTILVSHSVGISVTGNNSVQLEGTLWGSGTWRNITDCIGNVTTGTVNVWGDPGFVDPDNGDYHIDANSAAVDAGAYPTLNDDIDGDPRPAAFGPDIGADERPGPGLQLYKWVSQDTRNPGQVVTYTLTVTGVGTGPVDNAILTDLLPLEQRATAHTTSMGTCATTAGPTWGGQVRCTLGTLNIGDSVYITITAQVTTNLPPILPWPMHNSAWITGTQASSFAYADVYLQDCHVRLNDGASEWDNVQAAVDASTGPADVVKVAGTCTGINTRGGVQQVAYISKTVTVRGGYSPANWTAPDPDINPTTLDAMGQGRVIYIAGNISPTLEGLRITNGLAPDNGGGIYAADASVDISGCQVFSNTAHTDGGGLYLYRSSALLSGNTIISNTAHGNGGGLGLDGSDATLTNTVVTDNLANVRGSGLSVIGSSPRLLHSTIARNSGGDGSGVYVTNWWANYSTVALTNTILASHNVGIAVTAGNTATLETTLWCSNAYNYGGGGTIAVTKEYTGNPAFMADGYHLTSSSTAIDKGLDVDVVTDIDGDIRPIGLRPDIGADEARLVFLPVVLRQYR